MLAQRITRLARIPETLRQGHPSLYHMTLFAEAWKEIFGNCRLALKSGDIRVNGLIFGSDKMHRGYLKAVEEAGISAMANQGDQGRGG